MLQLSGSKPIPGVMFGLTHELDGAPIIREARILKVGIGMPRGRALNPWIHTDHRWYFRMGRKVDGKLQFQTVTPKGLATRAEAEQFYHENIGKAEVCPYPRKASHFVFTKAAIGDDGSEVFEPDFEAMEAHGPAPVGIDIIFLDDVGFTGGYQMWSTSECRCKGDGVTASRVLSMAANDDEKRLAEEAKRNGEKYFPIIGGCWTNGCSYSKPTINQKNQEVPSLCKPGGDLKFQLAKNIRVGGTAYFHTSGIRSITHLFSSIERIKSLTGGRLAGIPLKMVVRPYKTKHNGQTATQYGVSLEFRAEDVESLRKNLMEQAWKFGQLAQGVTLPAPRRHLIDAAPGEEVMADGDDDEQPISAQAMTDEFYADQEGETQETHSAAAATNTKTASLADKLKAKRETVQAQPAAAPQPAPEQAAAPAEEPETIDNPRPGDDF